MDNKKIIDRIRKLLTMSKDSSSPNEAAIAAGRAAKLMQQYNLETAEVILSNITEDTITENSTNTKYSTFPSWASYLAIPVAHLNDCECRLTSLDENKYSVEFLGTKEDSLVASYIYDFLISEIQRMAKRFKKEYFTADRKQMFDFRLGASKGVHDVLRRLMLEKEQDQENSSTGKGLVIVKNQLIKNKYDVRYNKKAIKHRESDATYAGYEEGKKVSIRDGLTSDVKPNQLEQSLAY